MSSLWSKLKKFKPKTSQLARQVDASSPNPSSNAYKQRKDQIDSQGNILTSEMIDEGLGGGGPPVPPQKVKSMFDIFKGVNLSTLKSRAASAINLDQSTSKRLGDANTEILEGISPDGSNFLSKSNKLTSGELNRLNVLSDKMADAYTRGDASAFEAARTDLKNYSDSLFTPRRQRDLVAKNGKTKAEVSKKMITYRRAALALGGIAGLMFMCWVISNEVTGCYKFTGSESEKIDCPQNGETCGCGGAPKGISDPEQISQICGGGPPGTGEYANFPFCCIQNSNRPTCTGTAGNEGAVYYSWKELPISAVIPMMVDSATDLVGETFFEIGELITNLIKYGSIALVVGIVIFILIKIFGSFNSGNSSRGPNVQVANTEPFYATSQYS